MKLVEWDAKLAEEEDVRRCSWVRPLGWRSTAPVTCFDSRCAFARTTGTIRAHGASSLH